MVKVEPDFNIQYPDGDATSTEAYATLARAGEACVQELGRFMAAHFDMPMDAGTVLAVLDGAGEALTPSQISERVLVASATMTTTLDLLERRNWVRRTPNPDDRRSTLVEITADGRATADRLLPGIRAIELGALSPSPKASASSSSTFSPRSSTGSPASPPSPRSRPPGGARPARLNRPTT